MKEPRVIDAEFTVVNGPERQPWNGVGLPPRWHTEGWAYRIIYVVVWLAFMGAVVTVAHWAAHFIGPMH